MALHLVEQVLTLLEVATQWWWSHRPAAEET